MEKIPPNIRSKIPPVVAGHLKSFEDQLNKISHLNMIEEKTKVPKLFLVLGVGFLFLVFLTFDLGGELLSNVVGLVYPVMESFKSIDSKDSNEQMRFGLHTGFYSALSTQSNIFPLSNIFPSISSSEQPFWCGCLIQ